MSSQGLRRQARGCVDNPDAAARVKEATEWEGRFLLKRHIGRELLFGATPGRKQARKPKTR